MKPNNYQVVVYYFANWHVDSLNETLPKKGKGWTEWPVLQKAQPRFPGHQQPKVPLWGYEDEADPAIFAKKIDAAADHGVDVFLYDWYWRQGGPYLARALEEGYLRAPNANRLKFALMWANHDFDKIAPPAAPGNAQTWDTFERICHYVVETYFTSPHYWTLDGRPFFSIYEIGTLISHLGGTAETRRALDHFREITRRAGLPDLHLNLIDSPWSVTPERLNELGADSVTSYVWAHHSGLSGFPETPYEEAFEDNRRAWERSAAAYPQPYFPNVTVGWDPTPRTDQTKPFQKGDYPNTPILSDNTPENFERALRAARDFVDHHPTSRNIVTVYAWNEWTEGGYLEPDTVHGFAHLEAIRRVFRNGP